MRKLGKAVIALAAVGLVSTSVAACSSSDPKPIADISSLSGKSTSVQLDSGFATALAVR